MHKKALAIALCLIVITPIIAAAQVSDIDPEGTSTCVSINNNLRYRSTDSQTNGEVSALQDFLQASSYLKANPIGYFGLLTTAAVKSFQAANSISPTGYVGPLTRAKILAVSCSDTSNNASASTTTVTTTTAVSPTTTSVASTVNGCNAGSLYNSITGSSCASATVPGTSSTLSTTAKGTVSYQGYYFSRDLAADEKDYDVLVLQAYLKAKGFLVLPETSGGVFDLVTRNALAAYQVSVIIKPADGFLGPLTRGQINNAIAATPTTVSTCPAGWTCIRASDPAPTVTTPYVAPKPAPLPPPVYAYPGFRYTHTLDIGSQGPDVIQLQTFLQSKGFLVIPAGLSMGTYDNLTKAAVAALETSVGISPADGVLGPVAIAYLNANLAAGITTTPISMPMPQQPPQTPEAPKGDLIVSDFSWTPVAPSIDQTDKYLYINFTVKNIGTGPITVPTDTAFTLYKGNVDFSNTAGELTIGTGVFTLNPGESKTFTNFTTQASPNLIFATAGTFPITMKADSRNLVPESNEGNNSLTKIITVNAAAVVVPPVVITPPAPNTSCPQTASIGTTTYSVDPCTVTMSMVDGKGDRNFGVTITSNATSSAFGFERYGYGVGLPTYAVLGDASGGMYSGRALTLTFTDSVLSADGDKPRVYTGYIPFEITKWGVDGGTTMLYVNVNLTVTPATN